MSDIVAADVASTEATLEPIQENTTTLVAAPDMLAKLSLPIEALQDVEMKVEVVFGRARLRLHELLDVRPGQVIELDRARNSPVEVLVNGTLFARGEIVVIDDSRLGVRISQVVTNENAREGRQ